MKLTPYQIIVLKLLVAIVRKMARTNCNGISLNEELLCQDAQKLWLKKEVE